MNDEINDENSKSSLGSLIASSETAASAAAVVATTTTTSSDNSSANIKPTALQQQTNENNEQETNIEIIIAKKVNNLVDTLDATQQESLIEDIYSDLIDDVLFGLMLQVHRAARLGYLYYLDPDSDPEFEKQFDIYDDNDVLGVFSHLNENFKASGIFLYN